MSAFFRKARAAKKVAKRVRKAKKRKRKKAKRQLRAERRKEKKLKKAEKKKAKKRAKQEKKDKGKEAPTTGADGSLANGAAATSAAAATVATTATLASASGPTGPDDKTRSAPKPSSTPQVDTGKPLSPEAQAAFTRLAEALEGDPNQLERMVNDHLARRSPREIDPDEYTILPRRAIIHSAATTAAQVAIAMRNREDGAQSPPETHI